MNPVERLTLAYEQMAAAQVAANERMTALLALLSVGVALGFVVLLVVALAAVGRRHEHAAIMAGINELRAGYQENWELLKLVKGWAESARAHSKDAAMAAKDAKAQAPEAERHVIEAVDAVPGRTAEVVVQKLEEFKKLLVPPLVLATALAGVAAAGDRATAADAMRHEGEVRAMEWWRAEGVRQ